MLIWWCLAVINNYNDIIITTMVIDNGDIIRGGINPYASRITHFLVIVYKINKKTTI